MIKSCTYVVIGLKQNRLSGVMPTSVTSVMPSLLGLAETILHTS